MITMNQYGEITRCDGCVEDLGEAWVVEIREDNPDEVLLWHPTQHRPMIFGKNCKGRYEERGWKIHYLPQDEEY